MTAADTARSVILGALRASPAGDVARPTSVDRAAPADRDLIAEFVVRMTEHNATVMRVESAGIAAAIETLGVISLAVPSAIPLHWLPSGCRRVEDSASSPLSTDDLDQVDGSVTGCRLAIASTGSIVLDGGELSGRRIVTLWPDLHVCIVSAADIVATVPQAVAGVDPAAGPVTWVSGPSATSDIEFRRVEGVHGPRRLVVLVVS
jgi:L-lactate dehydrogenase complex protein LldG